MVSNDGQETGKHSLKTFEKCPACGSEERLIEGIGKELKAKGLIDLNWNPCMQAIAGVVLKQEDWSALPIGVEVPGYVCETDVCIDCGLIYVVKLERKSVKKPSQILIPGAPPNRAERRAMGNLNPLGKNIPGLS